MADRVNGLYYLPKTLSSPIGPMFVSESVITQTNGTLNVGPSYTITLYIYVYDITQTAAIFGNFITINASTSSDAYTAHSLWLVNGQVSIFYNNFAS